MSASTSLHIKCRNSAYPRTDGLQRALVPDELVDWRVKWDAYKPINYTHPKVHGKSWADPDIQNSPEVVLNFNQIDGTVDRTSFMGIYQLDSNRLPLNPRGRTGICGRGSLGRWGPNHAADPIVTRWKTSVTGERVFDPTTKRFVLQFVAIERGSGDWAFPGGMVDAGEKCTDALKREFAEEALNSHEANPEQLEKMKKTIEEFFTGGTQIYSGYVDDPRNTDNAWMETIAVNFHDETGDSIAQLNLQAGSYSMPCTASLHYKCRNSVYPRSEGVQRTPVPDDKVEWSTPWNAYKPIVFTHPKVHGQIWADPDLLTSQVPLHFNQIDGKIDRTSVLGPYQLDDKGLPLNPCGRTGITGRGALGRWGPNHAADPIVTRWKIDATGQRVIDPVSKKYVLQFVAIERGDCGEWALPGGSPYFLCTRPFALTHCCTSDTFSAGMVDAGEKCTDALKREFSEEALNSKEATPEQLEKLRKLVEEFFATGTQVYSGYVDDPRNTDNAWMETVAVNFHDETADRIARFNLQAGDDAKKVCWMDVSSDIKLYASHRDFLQLAAKLRDAKW
ncbi:hypothetical protein PHET_07055 [Paragonimus heterotremus]|uniref:Nudix hydrolase domain-containing protein n=1 Tax=Paragonimus heterotremus TaxID=100268 RepID=A0A8J4TDN1_9TREM|nr:hypothetical protein PHET_07055 [Paragonimus heterotremus]